MLMVACGDQKQETAAVAGNPAAEGFNATASDEKAIKIADEVMGAMGGRENWDNTRYLQWTFLGNSRTLYWDKKTGDVRIDIPPRAEAQQVAQTLITNIFSGKGMAKIGAETITNPDSLQKYMTRAKDIWINDSYWLVMPFKLKDSGVTLKYVGEDTTQAGKIADVIDLTFAKVGKTPGNRYQIFVDKDSHLVTQWDYYTQAMDKQARFKMPWNNYQKYGNLMLSDNRGNISLSNIAAPDQLDKAVFTSFDPVSLKPIQ